MASQATTTTAQAGEAPAPHITPPQNDAGLEAEADDAPSGDGQSASDWTSISSSIYRGVIENGRRYQSLKEGEYWGPSDDQQFESMANNHLAHLLQDQFEENQYFRSPIGEGAQNVLDVGTGEAQWAIDVADKYPNVTVYGVDLHPPPQTWVPGNCMLEVDDVTKPWTWREKFDLVHIRWMYGSLTDEQWKHVYSEAYKCLKPGGYIEQNEININFMSDDASIPPDSAMAQWGPMFLECARKMGQRLDLTETMERDIAAAGFEIKGRQAKKYPNGSWPKHPLMKEIGRVEMQAMKLGLEGYAMFLLTHFGSPEPWTPEQVQELCKAMRRDLDDRKIHSYHLQRRVWAQKPLDATD